jgi:hypothetical protein
MTNDDSDLTAARTTRWAIVLGLLLAAWATVAVPTSVRADLPPDACGADAGPNATGDAGSMGRYTFAEPIAAPIQGARFEPSCRVSAASQPAGWIGWGTALLAIASMSRRRTRASR